MNASRTTSCDATAKAYQVSSRVMVLRQAVILVVLPTYYRNFLLANSYQIDVLPVTTWGVG